MPRRRIAIVQPYISQYRTAFFQRLAMDLSDRGVELVVAHGDAHGDQAVRADTASLETAVHLRQRTFRIGSRTLVHRDLGELARNCDALVLEQALHNVELYTTLLNPRRTPAIALWGHTYTHLRTAGWARKVATGALTRRAHWFFAFTQAGADHEVSQGFPAERITMVYHSIDTSALREARTRVAEDRLQAFRERHRLVPGRTAVYLGGLDTIKRTGFLLAAAASVARRLPGFRLLVAGDGTERHLVEQAAARGAETVYLGNVFDDEKRALLGQAADLMLAPGAVGLCAVVSFALQTPVVTVPRPDHGPEFEYLENGRNCLIAPDDVESFAQTVADALCDPTLLARLKKGCEADAGFYTLERFSSSFADGVVRMLETDGRCP
ncbi:glycosyltransferase family 4 protein [Streptomyces sp. NPDC002076]